MSFINNIKKLLQDSSLDDNGNLILKSDGLELIKEDVLKYEQQLNSKVIDVGLKYFVANGVNYHIEDSLSIDRYIKYEEIEIELGYARAFSEVFDEVRSAMDDINKQRQGDAYIKLYNIINGMQQAKLKKPNIFRYCALFINSENEDRRFITEDMINKKVEDWRKEGLDYRPFFAFAINSIPGFIERFKKLTPSIS